MGELIPAIVDRPELGIFGLLFLYTFFIMRKDALEHRREYKEITEKLLIIVESNTVAKTKLNDSIEALVRESAQR